MNDGMIRSFKKQRSSSKLGLHYKNQVKSTHAIQAVDEPAPSLATPAKRAATSTMIRSDHRISQLAKSMTKLSMQWSMKLVLHHMFALAALSIFNMGINDSIVNTNSKLVAGKQAH